MPDIPTVDNAAPVTTPATPARSYPLLIPYRLSFRVLPGQPAADRPADMGRHEYRADEYQSIMQRLIMAPARLDDDGQIVALLDPDEAVEVGSIDVRAEIARSPVVRETLDQFVEVLGLLAKERAILQTISQTDPEAPADVDVRVDLLGALAYVRAQLQIVDE